MSDSEMVERKTAPIFPHPCIVMSGPASRSSRFALEITGPFGPAECSAIIRHLELTREMLLEDAALAPNPPAEGRDTGEAS